MHKYHTEIAKLSQNVAGTFTATSPTKVQGTSQFVYFQPKSANEVDAVLNSLTKMGMPAATHLSSLNNKEFPIVRIPLTEAVVLGKNTGITIDGLITMLNAEWKDAVKINPKDVSELVSNISKLTHWKDPRRGTEDFEFVAHDEQAAKRAAAIFKKYDLIVQPLGTRGTVSADRTFHHSPEVQTLYVLCEQIQDKLEHSATKDKQTTATGFKRGTAKVAQNNKAANLSFMAKLKSLFKQKQ